jgi:hypothetical protein
MKSTTEAFLEEINSLTKHTIVIYNDMDFCFEILLKEDPFLDTDGIPIIVSKFFEKTVKELAIKHFDKPAMFNNGHTIFWVN